MNSTLKVAESDNVFVSTIPPVVSNNLREKITAEKIPENEILLPRKYKLSTENVFAAITYKSNVPIPRYPLSIVWSPSLMFFEIDNYLNLQKLRLWNACTRSIYINCCGLWGDNGRLGAKWRCFPRTRYLLAPGLSADLFIQATPREQSSPVPSAQIAMQLAAGHKRDNVVGYFVIPILVKFKKYTKPCLEEEENSNNKLNT